MQISSTYWLPDITDWCPQQEQAHLQYTDLSNVALRIFSIIPHVVGVEASSSHGQDVLGWRKSKATGETHRGNVVVRQVARANNRILAGDYTALDTMQTENNLELKIEAEERKLYTIAKGHDFLEMWRGSQNLCATQKESPAQNKQMTAVEYISDTEEIIKASWSNFEHDGMPAFKLSEKITVATSNVREGPPWRTNSSIKCPPNQQNGPLSSVSNGCNPLERFRVRVGTGRELLQWFLPHENPYRCNWAGFTTKNPAFQPHNFGSN